MVHQLNNHNRPNNAKTEDLKKIIFCIILPMITLTSLVLCLKKVMGNISIVKKSWQFFSSFLTSTWQCFLTIVAPFPIIRNLIEREKKNPANYSFWQKGQIAFLLETAIIFFPLLLGVYFVILLDCSRLRSKQIIDIFVVVWSSLVVTSMKVRTFWFIQAIFLYIF